MASPHLATGRSSRTIVIVPARLAASRLPNKPLAEIAGVPMIVHVWRRAVEAGLGRVVVACGEAAIVAAVEAAGGEAMLTDPDLPSGTDRVFQALNRLDPSRELDRVINLQGDLPAIAPSMLHRVIEPLERLGCDIATLAVPTEDADDRASSSVVKAVMSPDPADRRLGRALYFTRAGAPWGMGPVLHHIGIYAYTRDAIERFATLPPSPLEQREKLEQLRALENGMSIGIRLVDEAPFGVDTPSDLERARLILGQRS